MLGASVVFLLFSTLNAAADDEKGSAPQFGLGINADFGKWDGVIQWVYNSTDAPPGFTDPATTAALLQGHFAEWAVVCGVRAQYLGVDDTADITDTSDGIVVVEWDAGIGGAAGLAGPSWNAAQDRTAAGHFTYTDGTMRLNPTVYDATGMDADQLVNNFLGFGQTASHEFGHLIGLGHSSEPESIMWANPYNSLNHLRRDDIDSCRAMYGYSDLYIDPKVFRYLPDSMGVNNYDFIFLAAGSDPNTAITVDDGTEPGNSQLLVTWQHTANDGYMDTMTQYVVDPTGMLSVQTSANVQTLAAGTFGIASFARLRELPGVWTVYASDSTGLLVALQIDVQTAPADSIEAPGATLTRSENPATRQTSLTVNVNSVSPLAITANQVTVNWHIGTQGFSTDVVAVPGNAARNFAFGDLADHDVHVEIIDDQPRYEDDPPNNVGGAGDGWQTLLPYFSSGRNHGPDLGGDNSSDVVLFDKFGGDLFLWNLHGNLIDPRGAIAVLSDTSWTVISNKDFNGDGKSDLMFRHEGDGRLYLWLMNGRIIESFGLVGAPSANWVVRAVGDFDGDGNADLVWRNFSNGQMYIWFMDGTTILSAARIWSTAAANTAEWFIIGDEDFSGDGIADLMWLNGTSGQVYFWEMDGTRAIGDMIVSSLAVAIVDPSIWIPYADGDLNGDGMADLVWQRRGFGQDGKVYYWQMNGGIIDSSGRISIVGDFDWEIRGHGDYNRDGNADLLWYNLTTGEIYHWQQMGATTLAGGQIAVGLPEGWAVLDPDFPERRN